MSRERVDAVRATQEAFNAGDDDAVASLAHPDIEWQTGLVGTPTYRGKEGVLAMLRDVRKAWADMAMQIVGEPRVVGDAVIVEVRLSAYGRTSGVPVSGTQYLVAEFRSALVWRVKVYMSQSEALEAVEPSE